MDGQPRTSPKDAGADEVSSAPVIARILTPAMVGPFASDLTPACQPVIASADDGNVAANVLDGDLNTRWSASGNGQWIQFCLDDTVAVSGVQIAFYSGNVRTSTFDVLVGNDTLHWTTAATGLVSSGTSLSLQTFSFTSKTGRYVRIVGHGNSVNAWNSYAEVRIQTGSSARTAGKMGVAASSSLNSYPNPFNDHATVSFNLEKAGIVNLTVYDINGKQVKVLVSTHLEAGAYNIPFDASSKPTGTYILSLSYNGKVSVRKIQKL
jgi:Tol biopolymer transport system component